MIVVSDTSPVRALAHLQLLTLLEELFDEVFIPPAVLDELERPKSMLPPLSIAPYSFIRLRGAQPGTLLSRLRGEVDAGEAEAIALAIEIGAASLLIDDLQGRRVAEREGVKATGTLGVLIDAKRRRLVPAIAPLIDRLEKELRFFVAGPVRMTALREAGELP